jgi:CheY-like chemotaxis protein
MDGNKVILLVEDDPDDAVLTIRALKRSNVTNELVVVKDGVEALDYLFGTDAVPSVVLLDLNLARIDGREVLKRMRADERTRLLPVVVLTSSNEEEDLVQSYDDGCNSYVRKPVDFRQFSSAVHQLGLYWLLLNEPPPRRGNA